MLLVEGGDLDGVVFSAFGLFISVSQGDGGSAALMHDIGPALLLSWFSKEEAHVYLVVGFRVPGPGSTHPLFSEMPKNPSHQLHEHEKRVRYLWILDL